MDVIESRASRKDEESERGKPDYESEDGDEGDEKAFQREYSLTL